MKRLFYKILKIFIIILIFIIVLIGSLYGVLQSAKVQTAATRLIADYFSDELNTLVDVKRVDISFFNTLILEGLYVEDHNKDTLLFTKKLFVKLTDFSIKKNVFVFNHIELYQPYIMVKQCDSMKYNFSFIIDYFSSNDTSISKPIDISSSDIKISDGVFVYKNIKASKSINNMDYNNLYVKNLYLSLNDIVYNDSIIECQISKFSFLEKNGNFSIREFSGIATYNDTSIWLKNSLIRTQSSYIKGNYKLLYNSKKDFEDFVHKVRINAHFDSAKVAVKDLGKFIHGISATASKVYFSGKITGKIDEIKAKNIVVEYGRNTLFDGNIELTGLPDIEHTFMHLSINKAKTTAGDINTLPLKHQLKLSEELNKLGTVSYTGNITGLISDFVTYGKIESNLGIVKSDLSLKFNESFTNAKYTGNIVANKLDIGQLVGEKMVKTVSFDTKLAGEGFNLQDLSVKIDGIIKQIFVNGYNYTNININGLFENKLFEGEIASLDPNMIFKFNGIVDLKSKMPQYDFNIKITNARPYKLNLYKNDSLACFSSHIELSGKGKTFDDLTGNLKIQNMQLTNAGTIYSFAPISISVQNHLDTIKEISLYSGLADVNVYGKINPTYMVYFVEKTLNKYFSTINVKQEKSSQHLAFNFDINVKNIDKITSIFLPELQELSNTKISGKINEDDNELQIEFNSDKIVYDGISFDNTVLLIKSDTVKNMLTTNCMVSLLALSDSLFVEKLDFETQTRNDSVLYKLTWSDESKANSGDILGLFKMQSNNSYYIQFVKSNISIADEKWQMSQTNKIEIDSTDIGFTNFILRNQNQSITIEGNLSEEPDKTVTLKLNHFDISAINKINPDGDFMLSGISNGTVELSNIYNEMRFISKLNILDLEVNNDKIGNAYLKSSWDDENKVVGLNLSLLQHNKPRFNLTGLYYPQRVTENIDFTASLDKFNIKIIEPFLDDALSVVRGKVTGKIKLSGNLEKPVLDGKLKVFRGGFNVDYLNTRYTFTDYVYFSNNKISFDSLMINDILGGIAVVDGDLHHNYFADFNLDLHVLLNEPFYCLNTTAGNNDLFYGKVLSTGTIDITGPTNDITIDVNATTATKENLLTNRTDNTTFNISLSEGSDVDESKFVRFVRPQIQSQKTIVNEYIAYNSGVTVFLNLNVTPDAQVQLVFDETIGDMIKAKGNANLKMEISKTGDMSLSGDYEIEDGDYLFTLQNIINKRFIIEKGGLISWTGDPYNAEIDLQAKYVLSTALSDLVDTTQQEYKSPVYKNRTTVECIMNLSDQLMNPHINFDLALPMLSTDVQSQVKGLISTEEDMNKQIFSLMALGKFIPASQFSGLMANSAYSNAGANTTSELLSNQISNWLSQIHDDFDIGFKYRPGDEISNDQLELALKTQFFNNRLIVNGNVATADNQATSNIVGDVSVEYKLRRDGKVRVKAFNRSNNYHLTTDDETAYTQGVGLFYREEFDSFEELFFRYMQKIGIPPEKIPFIKNKNEN